MEVGAGLAHDTERPDIETASDDYATRRFGGPVGAWLLCTQSELIEALLMHLPARRCRVLEIGGGHGQVAPLLLERGHDVVVHGSDPVCFRRLEPLKTRYGPQLGMCVSNLTSLPFADHALDLVIAVRLLAHVRDWRRLLDEITRVTRGHLMVEFARAPSPLLAPAGNLLFRLKRHLEGTTRPFFTYDEKMLLAELQHRGFQRVASGGQHVLPMVMHRAMRNPGLSSRLETTLRRLGVGDASRSPVILLVARNRG